MRSVLVFALCIVALACTRPFEPRESDVVGEWEKIEDTLPPINLVLTQTGSDLSARLRLSGAELNGTAELDGSQLLLIVAGRAEPLVGEFISVNELVLRFDGPAGVYTLHKK